MAGTRRRNIFALLVLVVALLIVLLLATDGTMEGETTLLTFAEESGQGGTAQLHLRVEPGTGQVFIDSFPLTRLDTQSSARYANAVACDFLDVDCSQYNFYYTIRANTGIVGGPSAGASMAALTVAVLDHQEVRQDVAMTGTINSGGIIGPVGGVAEKIEGASMHGITTVLIPTTINHNMTDNLTVSLEVIRVATLEDAMEELTGESYAQHIIPAPPPVEYQERMQNVSGAICSRMHALRARVSDRGLLYNDSNNFTGRLQLVQDDLYSRASLCFSANIELSRLIREHDTVTQRKNVYRQLVTAAKNLERSTSDRNISTIADLEVYAIVQERVLEAKETLAEVNSSDPAPARIAYAEERLVSAVSWARFFGMESQPITLDEQHLRTTCTAVITEAEERINYLGLYLEDLSLESEQTLKDAYRYQKNEPILCIFAASKAKAQANLVLGALSISDENVQQLLDSKLAAADAVIARQQQDGYFPILGYSYREYAENLRAHDKYSALSFAELSLELSGLDVYFPHHASFLWPQHRDLILFLYGVLFGLAVAGLLLAPERPVRPKPNGTFPGKKR